jgi:hypothetical protein
MARLCVVCKSVVSYASVSDGYACVCVPCDTDLFLFETILEGN